MNSDSHAAAAPCVVAGVVWKEPRRPLDARATQTPAALDPRPPRCSLPGARPPPHPRPSHAPATRRWKWRGGELGRNVAFRAGRGSERLRLPVPRRAVRILRSAGFGLRGLPQFRESCRCGEARERRGAVGRGFPRGLRFPADRVEFRGRTWTAATGPSGMLGNGACGRHNARALRLLRPRGHHDRRSQPRFRTPPLVRFVDGRTRRVRRVRRVRPPRGRCLSRSYRSQLDAQPRLRAHPAGATAQNIVTVRNAVTRALARVTPSS